MKYNEKTMKREVICPICKTIEVSTDILPECSKCLCMMITVVRNFDGEMITGTEDKTNYEI